MSWPSEAPRVPGYQVGARLGAGAGGAVWRARPLGGGPNVAVKVVRGGAGAGRELAALRAVQHPHVVPLHDAVALADGSLALVLELVGGGSLGALVAARGHLTPAEVVTVVAPLAATLADLHAQGVQHGDLAPGNVLFDETGRPLLADLGTVRVTGEPRDEVFGTAGYVDPVVLAGGAPGPAGDVYGLGALAWFALTGEPPAAAPFRRPLADLVPAAPLALVAAVESAVDPDPERRPSPDDLAAAVYAAARAAPVWRAGGAPADGGLTHRIRAAAAQGPAPGRRHRSPPRPRPRLRLRGRGRGRVVVAVAACLGVGAPVVAVVSGDARPWHRPAAQHERPVPGEPTTASAAAGPAATGSAATASAAAAATAVSSPSAAPRALSAAAAPGVVAGLSARRAQAFERADVALLADCVEAGSEVARLDTLAVRALAARGLSYRGLRLAPTSVSVVSSSPGHALVDVETAASAYEVVDRTGHVVQRVAAVSGRRARLELVGTGSAWRVRSVAPR